jgi:hypothetical protein
MANPHILKAAQAAKDLAEQRKAAGINTHRSTVRNLGLIAWVGWGLFILTALWYSRPGVWRTDAPPVGHPYHVVAKAYVDKAGHWRSFDNGEKITVTHWTTKDY